MDTAPKSSEHSQPNPFSKYVHANLSTKRSSQSQPSGTASNELQRVDSIDFDPIISNNKSGETVSKKKPQAPSSPRSSSTASQTTTERNTDNSKKDWDNVRKQYEDCENPEEKVELKQRYKEDILNRLKQLSEVAGNSKVADEIATIVDFLEILYPESPAINNFHEISKESRDAAMKLQEGLKHLAIAQHLLRQALVSSSHKQIPVQQ